MRGKLSLHSLKTVLPRVISWGCQARLAPSLTPEDQPVASSSILAMNTAITLVKYQYRCSGADAWNMSRCSWVGIFTPAGAGHCSFVKEILLVAKLTVEVVTSNYTSSSNRKSHKKGYKKGVPEKSGASSDRCYWLTLRHDRGHLVQWT